MKKSGVNSRSQKRVSFPATAGILGGWSSFPGTQGPTLSTNTYTAQVRDAFKNRLSIFKEFMAIVTKLRSSGTSKEHMELIERAVTLLDGHPRLIYNFAVFLPDGYAIEIQEDAVIIKVFESQENACAVDTGHSRPYQTTPGSLTMPVQGLYEPPSFGNGLSYPRRYSSSPSRASRPRKKSDRRQASASGVRRSMRRSNDSSLRRSADRSLRRPNDDWGTKSANVSSNPSYPFSSTNSFPRAKSAILLDSNGLGSSKSSQDRATLAYIMAVKQAFLKRPAVYKQFTDALQKYHASSADDSNTVCEVVSILKTHPHLALGFNEFLPEGHRIRMYDQTAYIVEYPDEDGRIVQKQIKIKT